MTSCTVYRVRCTQNYRALFTVYRVRPNPVQGHKIARFTVHGARFTVVPCYDTVRGSRRGDA